MALVSHVISLDHVIKRSCDLMGQEPIRVSYYRVKISGNRHSGKGEMFFVLSRNFYMMASPAPD